MLVQYKLVLLLSRFYSAITLIIGGDIWGRRDERATINSIRQLINNDLERLVANKLFFLIQRFPKSWLNRHTEWGQRVFISYVPTLHTIQPPFPTSPLLYLLLWNLWAPSCQVGRPPPDGPIKALLLTMEEQYLQKIQTKEVDYRDTLRYTWYDTLHFRHVSY